MTIPLAPLPEASKIPSLDSLETLDDIQAWVDVFFGQCESVLPTMSPEHVTKTPFVYDASVRGRVFRMRCRIENGARIVSGFEFPGETHNCTLKILPNGHIEGRFPDGSSLPKLSFTTSPRNGDLNMNNIADALRLAQAALESLGGIGEISWKLESASKSSMSVPDVSRQTPEQVIAVLAHAS